MKRGNLLEAQAICTSLVKADVEFEAATMLLSQILFQQRQFGSALTYMKQFVESHPTHWEAVSLWIEMQRRCGKLFGSNEVQSLFEKSEFALGTSGHTSSESLAKTDQALEREAKINQSGYHFCRGLYYMYTNQYNEALNSFNLCRTDSSYSERALKSMIDIYVQNSVANASKNENYNEGTSSKNLGASPSAAVEAIKQLLEEYPNKKCTMFSVLRSRSLIVSGIRADLDEAAELLSGVLGVDRDNIPALYVRCFDVSRCIILT